MGTTETGEGLMDYVADDEPLYDDPEVDMRHLEPLCEAPDWPAMVVVWAAFFVAGAGVMWLVMKLL